MRWWVLLLPILAGGCGSASVATPAAPSAPAAESSSSRFALRVVPLEVSITDGPVPLLARWQVVISASPGAAGRVDFVDATVRDAASGAVAFPSGYLSLSADQVAARAGTDLVPAGGSLSLTEDLQFALPSGGERALVKVAARITDDQGSVVTVTSQAEVE
jgi:hypothetical protein